MFREAERCSSELRAHTPPRLTQKSMMQSWNDSVVPGLSSMHVAGTPKKTGQQDSDGNFSFQSPVLYKQKNELDNVSRKKADLDTSFRGSVSPQFSSASALDGKMSVETPVVDRKKKTDMDDGVSTAAPSPAYPGSCSSSTWNTPLSFRGHSSPKMQSPGKKQRAGSDWPSSFPCYNFGMDGMAAPSLFDFPTFQVDSVEFNNLFGNRTPNMLEESLFGIQEVGEFQSFMIPDGLQQASEVDSRQCISAAGFSASTGPTVADGQSLQVHVPWNEREHLVPTVAKKPCLEAHDISDIPKTDPVCTSGTLQDHAFFEGEVAPQTPRKDAPQTPRHDRQEILTPWAPKKQTTPKLVQALCSNSLEEVKAVLADDPEAASMPIWDSDAEPPLCCAARQLCSPEIFEFLLGAGAQVNATDSQGLTPLDVLGSTNGAPVQHLVPALPPLATCPDFAQLSEVYKSKTDKRRRAIADLLVQAGAVGKPPADSALCDSPPRTPRHGCCKKNTTPGAPKKSTAPSLIQAFCSDSFEEVEAVLVDDPEAAWTPLWEHDSDPPLCAAVRHACSPQIVKLLLENGADINMADSKGNTPFALLRLAESQPLQHCLVPPLPFLAPPPDYEELLGNAERQMKERCSAIADLLTHAGAIDEQQELALAVCATPPQTPRCKQSTPGAPKKPTAPRMCDALCLDSLEQVKAVLAADPDAAWEPFWDLDSELPLCYAAQCLCDPSIVELLLEAGAEVNAVGSKGKTPFALLDSAERPPLQNLVPPLPFQALHADTSELVGVYETLANERRNSIASILLNAGAIDKLQEVTSVVLETPPQTPRMVARELVAPSAPKKPTAPPMLHAICSDSAERVRAVLAEDADAAWMPFWDHDDETPLCSAARRLCDPQIVEVLLKGGAQVNVVDTQGFTPLELAHLTKGAPSQHLIPQLPSLARGPDPVGAAGIHDAQAEERRTTITNMLLQAGAADNI
eukprot:TRINITY_DN57177_c0_g1_i1.p1 TRINITY_DN57177_c0_g1~~TRINITY_DN57177_c0_g1_i1.p1  ORF type:complete len:970 (-),score=178.57 TRINITY_DN57177_c0_g1_i1:67-2976(-)